MLVSQFDANKAYYLSPPYQEEEERRDFIDKFWTALGWDVNHDQQTNPDAQEVKVERGVTMSEGRKRADNAFSLDPD
jgi:adenine-specific DNA-methyltransferase